MEKIMESQLVTVVIWWSTAVPFTLSTPFCAKSVVGLCRSSSYNPQEITPYDSEWSIVGISLDLGAKKKCV